MSAPPRHLELERALAALPETVVGEILFGRLVTQPRPAWKHAYAASRLGHELGPPFQTGRTGENGPGPWVIVDEPELQLGPHVVVPDLAGWRADALPPGLDVARVAIVPDWVCEVLSPATERFDRDEKALVYAANGVEYLWLVDPIAKTVEARRSARGVWHDLGIFAGDAVARIAPFDAIELSLARLWSP